MKIFYSIFLAIIFVASSMGCFAFSDLNPGDKYSDAVFFLEDLGILEGYVDGEVKVDQSITRAEFLKMVLEYNQEDVGNLTGCFEDVKGDWSEKYVCYAESQGWVKGYDDGNFLPAREVNFAETMKMITTVIYANYYVEEFGAPEDWFYAYVDFLVEREVDSCEVNSYDQILTRGIVADLLYKVELSEGFNLNAEKCKEIGDTYQDLGMGHNKYRGDVYFGDDRLYGEDFDTFERINEHYARDKNKVYLRDEVVEGADPETFELLFYVYISDRAYGKDAYNVYFGTEKMEGIDQNSIEVFDENFFKDVNGVYYQDRWAKKDYQIIGSADPQTFSLIAWGYSKDANNVYYGINTIEDANVESFEFIGGDHWNYFDASFYAKDANNVYCGTDMGGDFESYKVLEDADLDSFERVVEEKIIIIKDVNYLYKDCEIVE